MRAWVVDRPGPADSGPLLRVEREIPEPRAGQVRLRISVCGVCRTDLHLAEGDLTPKHPRVVPGHEVVGIVDRLGPECSILREGDRVGVPWLAHTCGVCRFCTSGRENLCMAPLFTGWDVDGGYAEYAVVDEAYAYRLPAGFSDEEATTATPRWIFSCAPDESLRSASVTAPRFPPSHWRFHWPTPPSPASVLARVRLSRSRATFTPIVQACPTPSGLN